MVTGLTLVRRHVQDWQLHKSVCKPESQGANPRVSNDDERNAAFLDMLMQLNEDVAPEGAKDAVELGGEWIEGETHVGPERVVEIPGTSLGGKVRLVSRTLLPTELRKMREEIRRFDSG